MIYKEFVSYAFQSLKHRNIRSWLTILGIVVGIVAVVVLIGLAQGLKEQITSQLQGFGPRTIVVVPFDLSGGSSSALAGGASSMNLRPSSGKLYDKDFDKIAKFGFIEEISRVIVGRSLLGFKGEEITGSVYGIEPDIFQKTATIEIEKGRFLEQTEKQVAVIGNSIAEDTFEKKVDVGALIQVGGKTFRVVGVLKKTGNSFTQLDSVVLINFEESRDIFSNQLAKDEITAIRIIVKEGYPVNEAGEAIEDTIISSHKVTEDTKDFNVITPAYLNDQVGSVTGILTVFLGGIAAISLLIGGIGISNTMFMSVLERRREIGVIKSVGATEQEIRDLFLVESGIIGIFGGTAGIILGAIVIFLIKNLADFPAVFTFEIGFGALLFSAIIGILAGTIPASQAAKLDPIEALRYE